MNWMSTSGMLLVCLASLLDSRPIDLNSAGEAELEGLPGIGPVKAAAIVEFREAYGPFLSLDDLLEVPGIGPSTLERIAPLIMLDIPDGAARPDTAHWLGEADTIVDPLLSMAVLDIGEGDAVLLRAAGGRTALVDGGPDDGGATMPAIIYRLSQLGVDSIDCVLLTHPHEDHAGGLDEVVATFQIDTLFDPGYPFPSPVYMSLLETVERTGSGYALLDSGRVIRLSAEVAITVLDCGNGGDDQGLNENSAVLLVSCGAFTMLLPGDIEQDAERALAADIEPVVAMLMPHHGSGSSAFPPFIRRLSPQFAVASAGRNNPFGHPHSAVLAAYEGLGATVLRTDTEGTIFIDTDGICVSTRCSMRGSD
jgi:competence protein ComEC